MATTIEGLQQQSEKLKGELLNSPTAYSRADPSFQDVSTSKQLSSLNEQIKNLKSEQLRAQWYGPDDETQPKKQGAFVKTLKALQAPLNAVMGAGQYALGKGTSSSLTGNINKAIKSGLTAGDILKQYDVPRGVQVPLGFALDVMFDPVNWATAGAGALIPRVGYGLVKGAQKAGVTGALEAGKVRVEFFFYRNFCIMSNAT